MARFAKLKNTPTIMVTINMSSMLVACISRQYARNHLQSNEIIYRNWRRGSRESV
jgi:hypothetical protein